MADLGFAVNTEELPEGNNFNPVPAGKYTVVITNSKLVPTNKTKALMETAGVSDYETFRKSNPKAEGFLVLEMDVQDGGAEGRKLFHNLNLINDSQQAAEIAAGQLRKILEAFKMKTFSGKSEELHNKRMVVDVAVKPAKPYVKDGVQKPGFASNECKGFYPAGTATGASAVAPVAAAVAGGAAKGPWAR